MQRPAKCCGSISVAPASTPRPPCSLWTASSSSPWRREATSSSTSRWATRCSCSACRRPAPDGCGSSPRRLPRGDIAGGMPFWRGALSGSFMKDVVMALVALVAAGGCSKSSGAAAAAQAPAAEPRVIESGKIDPAWLSYDAATKTLNFHLIAGLTGLNGALNFNGFRDGGLTLTVPRGWTVAIQFMNHDGMLPHSAEVIPATKPVPTGPVPPAFDGAFTVTLAQGLPPAEKRAYVVGFLAAGALADARRAGAEGPAALGRVLDSLSRGGGLRFPFGHTVYVTQLDEYYWWENHRPTRLYLALWEVNRRLATHER